MSALGLACVTAITTVLPGSWFAFSRPFGRFDWTSRLAIAVALSPAVLGLELLATKLVAIPFSVAAYVVVLVNAPAAYLIGRSFSGVARQARTLEGVAVVLQFALLAASLAVPWAAIPDYRQFSWHALLHSDIVYQVAYTAGVPEEPEIAGLVLAYPWIAHSYWAVIGWLTDVPPTRLYPITNLIWLLASCVLAHKLVASAFPLSRASRILSVTLMVLGGQVIGMTAHLITGDSDRWVYYFNDRIWPLLSKFRGFETMPFSVALLIALFMVLVTALKGHVPALGFILAPLLVALGVLYPFLAPAAFIAVAGLMMVLVATAGTAPPYSSRELVAVAGWVGLALLACVAVVAFFTQATETVLPLATAGRKAKCVQLCTALGVFAVVGTPLFLRSMRGSDPVPVFLTGVAGCWGALYVLTDFGELEYKYVLIAPIVLAPLAAAAIERYIRWGAAPYWGGVVLLTSALVGVELDRTWRRLPPSLTNAPRADESHFRLTLAPGESDAAWIAAVSSRTPEDTVLIASGSRIHVGPFVRRSLFAPSDANGELSAGYSVPNVAHLTEQRRYSPALIAERQILVERLFENGSPGDMARLAGALRSMDRPAAIRFPDASAPGIAWLMDQELGVELFSDRRAIVWFISRPELREWRRGGPHRQYARRVRREHG